MSCCTTLNSSIYFLIYCKLLHLTLKNISLWNWMILFDTSCTFITYGITQYNIQLCVFILPITIFKITLYILCCYSLNRFILLVCVRQLSETSWCQHNKRTQLLGWIQYKQNYILQCDKTDTLNVINGLQFISNLINV